MAAGSDPLTERKSIDVEQAVENETWLCGFYNCGPPPTVGKCGLPVEERPDLSVWVKEDKYALIVPAVFLVVASIFSVISNVADLPVLRPPDLAEFALKSIVVPLILSVFYYPLGAMVWYFGFSVAITRKVTHVLLLTILPLSAVLSSHGEGLQRDIFMAIVWDTLGTTFGVSLIWLQPTRRYVHWMKIGFAATERSEDRPHALFFILMQSSAMTMVQTPMIQWMLQEKKGLLIFIPFLSVALGDGLAEPIGKMCGKHKYEVSGLCTEKKFTRSYEGSACVFFFTAVACAIALPEMNWVQATLVFLLIPIANTVVEAFSPHTFDNHFMWGITWVLLWLIFDVLPTN